VAFLITFAVLLGGAAVWMSLFLFFSEADSALLNRAGEWLSPLNVSGWIFYILLCAGGSVPFIRRLLRRTEPPQSKHGSD
jgi:hypothetical protein